MTLTCEKGLFCPAHFYGVMRRSPSPFGHREAIAGSHRDFMAQVCALCCWIRPKRAVSSFFAVGSKAVIPLILKEVPNVWQRPAHA